MARTPPAQYLDEEADQADRQLGVPSDVVFPEPDAAPETPYPMPPPKSDDIAEGASRVRLAGPVPTNDTKPQPQLPADIVWPDAERGSRAAGVPGDIVWPEEGKPTGWLDRAADVGKDLKIGLNTAAEDVRELTGRIPVIGQPIVKGIDAADRYLHPEAKDSGDLLKQDTAAMRASQTPETQAAGSKKWWDQDKGTFGDAWSDWRSYSSGLVQSLPEQALTMAPAMVLAKTAYAARVAAGAPIEMAAKAASRVALLAGGLAEGALGGAQSSREVRDQVNQLPDDVLAQSDAYKELLKSGLAPADAKTALADDLATRAFVTAGVVTGMFGGMGDRAIVKIFTEQVGKSTVRKALGNFGKGALAEGLFEELPQSIGQQLAQNEAVQHANPNQSLSDDVINQGLGGAVVGALQGGGMGAASGAAGRAHQQQAQPGAQQQQPGAPAGEGAPAGAVPADTILPAGDPSEVPSETIVPPNGAAAPAAPIPVHGTLTRAVAQAAAAATPEPAARILRRARMEQLVADLDANPAASNPGVSPGAPGEPASPAANALPTANEGSPFEQAIQRPNAEVSTSGVTDGSPQPRNGVEPAPGLASNVASTPDSPIEQLLTGTGDQRHEVTSDLPPDQQQPAQQQAGARSPFDTDEFRDLSKRISAYGGTPQESARFNEILRAGREQFLGDGTRANPVQIHSADDVARAAAVADTDHSHEQGEANNVQRGHVTWNGLDGTIEVDAGGVRKGTNPKTGETWETSHTVPYGYWKGTKGADGMHVDVYFGPHIADTSLPAYVLDELDPRTGKFRQHKTFVGFASPKAATQAYLGTSSKTPEMVGGVTAMPVDQFTQWVHDESKTTKRLTSANSSNPLVLGGRFRKSLAEPRGKAPASILEFLGRAGGIDPRDPLIGDVRSALGTTNKFIPGVGMLIRPTGRKLDNLREAAAEAGYFTNHGTTDDAMSTTRVHHLLDLIADEAHGRRRYSQDDEVAARNREQQQSSDADAERLNEAKNDAREVSKAEKWLATEAEIHEAAAASLVNGTDVADELIGIIERNAIASENEQADNASEGVEDAVAATGTAEAGQKPSQTVQPARPDAGPAPEQAAPGERHGGDRQEPGQRIPGAAQEPEGAGRAEGARDQVAGNAEAASAEAAATEAADTVKPPPDEKHPGQFDELRKTTKAPETGPSDSGPVTVQKAETVKGVPLPPVRSASEAVSSAPKGASKAPEAPSSLQAPEAGPLSNLPATDLANTLVGRIKSGRRITQQELQQAAEQAYGSKLSEGKFNRKDMADALELAVNIAVKEDSALRIETDKSWQSPMEKLGALLSRLPTQRVRDDEQVAFDQFSTPPNYAAAVVFAANVKDGDTVLEPTAGNGSLVAAASNPGVKIIANELSERRVSLLRRLIGKDGQVFNENAEQIDNILDVKPTVVVMNPPFSQTAGRMGSQKVPMVAAEHIEAALNLLPPGGRLVAIVGRGMTMGAPSYRAWFTKIGKENSVVANIGVDGKVYEKYGTTFGTRLIVIDKVAPSGKSPILAEVQTVDDLMHTLEPIRDGRPDVEQHAAEPGRAGVAAAGEGDTGAALPGRPATGIVGAGEPGGGRVAADGSAGAAEPGGRPVRVEAGERDGVAPVEPGRSGEGRAGNDAAGERAPSNERKGSSGDRSQRDLQPAAKPEPGAAASSERAELETANAAPGTQAATGEISESLYQPYEPARVRVKGAKPHPGPLVESASMSSVAPPQATYEPHLPKAVIDKGLLSLAQLETTVYAGQAHSKMLPAADGETPRRRGYFIGDGTGVGKGREIAGIILDNWQQGRTKAVWVSEKKKLLNDARRDWSGLGQNPAVMFDVGKVKAGEPVTSGKGIGFITYDTLKGGMSDQAALARGSFVRKQPVKVNGQGGTVQRVEPGRRNEPANVVVNLDNGTQVTVKAHEVEAVGAPNVKTRVDQIVDWVGKDYDGVIAFDEAHNMGNATSEKGERGMKDAAQKAIAGLELQQRLPNARVVYVSATGATEVSNLAYADRLGLWGRGTAFASQSNFVSEVSGGGIAAMELIARDMKSLGLYTARNLSYDGVEYQRVEHKLDTNQREIYDTLAEAWQVVLRNINKALETTGGKQDGKAKAAAMSAFWGGHQRFFNQIVTSLQMPSVITAVEKDLAEGRQVVLQLTNTNEASQERAAAKAETAEQIEDLDITPRDQIIQLIEKSFPTQQYEEYVDSNGKVRSRPVTDKDGNPVQNKKAVAMREALIDQLASIRVPQGPLDMILDHFGTDVVAEVTGRGRRFVMKTDEKTGQRKRVEESRPASTNQSEIDSFQGAKKKIIIFSEAGGTGASYHADNAAPSKNARRAHYLLQGGWRADKAVQGLGRSHRTNQASAPIVSLVTTDLQGQKRFISSIARRLGQLGALTKGARQAGDQGIFSARDNLESTEARQALQLFFSDMLANKVEGVPLKQFEEQTGLKLRNEDDEGRSSGKQEMPPITQFLNRLLSLKIDMQNAVFGAFSDRLDAVIEARRQAGLLDVGLETVKADKITKDSEQVVHSIEGVGAETKHVKFTVADKFTPIDFGAVVARGKDTSHKLQFFAKSPNNKVYAVFEAPAMMDAQAGTIIDSYRIINPVSAGRIIARKNIDQSQGKWVKIDKAAAEKLWAEETDKAPEFVTRDMHLITGAILPIWDRLKGSTRVVRLQTDQGERFLGRVIPNGQISATLKALGAEAATSKIEPDALFQKLMAGGRATLANGWSLSRRMVAGEHRIELKGPSSFSEGNEVKADGVFTERIAYEVRYFVPTDEAEGAKVLGKLIQYRPVVDMSDAGVKAGEAQANDDEPLLKTDDTIGHDFTFRTPFTGKFQDHADAIYPILRAELDRLGLPHVALKLADEIQHWKQGQLSTAAGVFYRNVITLALHPDNKFNILHHEALHGLRKMGVFTEGEWAILTRASDATWRAQHEIDRKYKNWPEWAKQEEGIAHAYADWVDGKHKVDGRVARLFKRIRAVLEAIGNALRGQGFKTVESIFGNVNSGAIGGRALRSQDLIKDENRNEAAAYAINSGDGDLFKTEIVETPDGPREQTVIPGAEKITDKERAQRGADKPLAPKKPQKAPGGLFDEPDTQMPLFALAQDPATATQRTNVMQGFLARGQFLDRAIRMPFDVFGGVTRDGTWKPGAKLYDKAASVITGAKFSVEGRFAFANPYLEAARSGLVDRYGLDPTYVERERGRALDERAVMLQGAEVLKSLKGQNVGAGEARVLQAILTGEDVTDKDMQALAEPIRAAVDQLGQEAVELGLVSAESFERNRGTYLHRVYQKHESEQNGLVRMVNGIMGSRRKKIIGNQFRGRGMFQDVPLSRLMRDIPDFHNGARGKPENGEKFVRLDEMPNQQQLALDDNSSPEKALRTVYWPADQAIPDQYSGFTNQGTWEVRGGKAGKITIWRDFTKAEREKMGEILDARYTIGKTFMLMAHDLSVGKFYKDIAENEAWTMNATPNERSLDAAEWAAQRQRLWKHGDVAWVKVPDTEIPDSGGKKRYGALAGRYVREEIWRDLNEQQVMSRPNVWRTLLTQWKLNKTARSPVVHMNNVMSNFVLMDLMDVRFQDLATGIRSYITKDQHYEEAFQHGAFGADMMTQEVRDQVLKPILDELMSNNTYQQGGNLGALGAVSKFTEMLWSKAKLLDKKMVDLYRVEDEVFRMATYIRRRQLGDDAKQAADNAREQFIDYDIRAPWVNAARNTVLPFISYTYRAAPLVARAIATRPWKLGKYFALAYAVNALAYALTGGDEDKERRSLREAEQGRTWVQTPRMMRMPVNDAHGNPIFLDVRRWTPAGDVFDLSNGDIPAWMNLGGPLMIGAELFLNRQAFTGQEIINTKTDDWWDRQAKRADHLYKSWMPSAAWVPNSWYWEKIAQAAKGATDRQGNPYSVPLALSSSVGIKLKPQDVDDAFAFKQSEFRRVERELDTEARRLAGRQDRKIISEAEFNKAMQQIIAKKERNAAKAAETFKD